MADGRRTGDGNDDDYDHDDGSDTKPRDSFRSEIRITLYEIEKFT